MAMTFKKPRLYIRDKLDVVQDSLDPDQYYDATLETFLKGKVSVFSFKVLKDERSYELLTTQANLSFKFENESYWMNFVTVEQDEYTLSVVAYPLGLEFNNEDSYPYKADGPKSFEDYFKMFANGKALYIGRNEVSSKRLSLEWEGTESILSRLYSLANSFEAELEFVTEVNSNGSLKDLKLNIYAAHSDKVQGIGKDRRNETFYQGIEIKTVSKKEDKTKLATVVEAFGKDGLTISSINKEVFDDKGQLLYCTYNRPNGIYGDPKLIYAPQAIEKFPAQTNTNDKFTYRRLGNTEFETPEGLYGYMLGELKKIDHPEIEWTIDGYINGRIGDTVKVADHAYKPALLLDARIIGQKIYFDNPEQTTTTFSNVNVLASKLSDKTMERMMQLINENKQYTVTIETDNGTVFLDGKGQTRLFAVVKDGVVDLTANFEIRWYKNGKYISDGAFITVTPDMLNNGSAVYAYEVYDKNSKLKGRAEATLVNVNNGSNGAPGKTMNVYRAYAWDSKGQDRFMIDYPSENCILGSRFNNYGDFGGDSGLRFTLSGNTMTVTKSIKTTTNQAVRMSLSPYDILKDVPICNQIKVLVPVGNSVDGSSFVSAINDSNNGNIAVIPLSNLTPGVSKIITTKFTPTTNMGKLNRYQISLSKDFVGSIQFSFPKLEFNTIFTYYTPSPKDDYEAAWPKYQGIYASTNPQSSDPNDYVWSVFRGEPGKKGDTGPTLYTWIAYADDANGKGISLSPKGKYYMGTATNKITPDPILDPTKYLWAELGNQSQISAISDELNSVPRVTISSSVPAEARNGDQWWVMSNNQVIGFKVYGNGKWIDQTIQQNLLNIRTLNAIDINGANITGSQFVSKYDFKDSDGYQKLGNIKIKDDKITNSGGTLWGGSIINTYNIEYSPDGIDFIKYRGNRTDLIDSIIKISPDQIYMENSLTGYKGDLQPKYLNNYDIKEMALASGISWYDSTSNTNYKPKYKLIFLGNQPFMMISGIAVKYNGNIPGNNQWYSIGKINFNAWGYTIFSVTKDCTYNMYTDSEAGNVAVQTDGNFLVRARNPFTSVRLDGLFPLI